MRGRRGRWLTVNRALRADGGYVWPLAAITLFGAALLIGIVFRVGSATLLKDSAQTAADAAALAMAATESPAEARRIAVLNHATLVGQPTRQGADAWVVEVKTDGDVVLRDPMKGRARAAASKSPAESGDGSGTAAPLIAAGRARLVPLIENTGGSAQ